MKKNHPSQLSARFSAKRRTKTDLDDMENDNYLQSNKNYGASYHRNSLNSIHDSTNNDEYKSSHQSKRNRRRRRKYKDTDLKSKMVGKKSLKRLISIKRIKETEISQSFDESSIDSWDSSIEGPLKALKKMIKPKLKKKIDTSTAVIATLPTPPNRENPSRKKVINSETDGDSNDDVDKLIFTAEDSVVKPSRRRTPSRDASFTVDELLSLLHESSDRSATSFQLDIPFRKQHKIVDIQKFNSDIDDISVFTPEDDSYEVIGINCCEKLQTTLLTMVSLASSKCLSFMII